MLALENLNRFMLLVIIIDHSLTTIGLDGKGEGGGLRNCHKKQVFMKEQIHVSCWHDRDLINKKINLWGK